MRHASLTFDPAAAACDMPALLLIQRPRHATCQRHFRPSGRGMRHASVTFDPAAAACDMPALLSTQRPRHATCRPHFRSSGLGMRHAGASGGVCGRPANLAGGVRDASQVWPGTRRPSCRQGRGVLHTPYRAPPSVANTRPRGMVIHPLRDVWWGVCNTPLHRYVHSPLGRGRFTALPRDGRWGVCWASSRRPARGERRRRRGLHSARSAGC